MNADFWKSRLHPMPFYKTNVVPARVGRPFYKTKPDKRDGHMIRPAGMHPVLQNEPIPTGS